MFMKRPGHRIFDYTPRFYNPETDKKERRKSGIRKKRSPIVWLALIIVIIYIIIKLGGVT